MQIGVDIGSYVFDASAKTITFSGVTVTDIEQIKPIVNGTKGVVIFNPAEVGKFGILLGNVLTLQFDTTLQNDTDKLYICVNFYNSINSTEFSDKLLQVDAVGSTTYLGYANAGTSLAAANWAIKKIVETGSDVSITWADGNVNFDNIWNDRLTLTYS